MAPGANTPTSGPEKPHRIAGYEVVERLGEGAMGVVFKAKQLSLGRTVALKVLAPKLTQDERFVERFLREARATAQLSHPNIVRIYEVDRSKGGIHYYAMEYVDGPSAGALLKQKGRMPVREACRIVAQVARALSHAHAQGLVHRDVKPDNILLSSDGTAKLADLGLAHVERAPSDADTTGAGHIVGTPYYMSPEQADGKAVTARSDIYSLGASLYHLVAGTPPFVAPTAIGVITKHLTEERPDPRKANPEVSADLANAIRRMMALDPAQRYASATEAAEDLEAAARGARTVHAAAVASPPGGPRWKRTALWAAAALAAVAAISLAVKATRTARREHDADLALGTARLTGRISPGSEPERQRAAHREALAALKGVADRFAGTKAALLALSERAERAEAWIELERLQVQHGTGRIVGSLEQGRPPPPEAVRDARAALACLEEIAADADVAAEAKRRAEDAARTARERVADALSQGIEQEKGMFSRREPHRPRREPPMARPLLDLLPADAPVRAKVEQWLERTR